MRKNFLKTIYFNEINSDTSQEENYIKNIDIFKNITEFHFEESITYFVWENGSGKSTLLENIATTFWFNKEWWTKNSLFQTNDIDNKSNNWLQLSWQPQKFLSGFFFRWESVYNFINYQESIWWFNAYGWEHLHTMSHGQQFIRILESLMDKVWFYIFDEIESALSPENQLKAIEIIKYMAKNGSQFIIATHSPIILSIKQNSQIVSFDYGYIHEVDYDLVPCVDMYRRVLKK